MTGKFFDLRGKIIVITGAAGGIGSVVSRALGEEGAVLSLVDLPGESLDALTADLLESGVVAKSFGLRVEDRVACFLAMERAEAEFGRVDVLINCAGVNTRMRPEEYEEETWDRILDVNLKGTFNMCQAVYRGMKFRGCGKIINFGSILSLSSNAVTSAYSASKGGVLQLTRSLSCAWGPDGINVNAILPGWIDTPLSRQARIDIPGHAERVVATTPLGRWGLPEDLIGAVIFLSAAGSDFVAGAGLLVDGGVTAHI
ncbi:SDR family NAD(P)-dependent oxidoreductase [Castellaniella sp. WN]